jgi:CHAT domain-containing protein
VERLPPADRSDAATAAALHEWDEKWRAIEANPEAVPLGDHWRVCGLKFRFRVYSDLDRCLALMEARVARLDAKSPERRYAPVLANWMRAAADAELGDVQAAAKAADVAWQTLPDNYHDVHGVTPGGYGPQYMFTPKEHDFADFAIAAGGSEWIVKRSDVLVLGTNNPAGLDMRPQTIAMSIAAERAVLHQQLHETEVAASARADLQKWRDAVFYYEATALAIGPSFAQGDYAAVVKDYEEVAQHLRSAKGWAEWWKVSSLGIGVVQDALASILTSDERAFAVALEDLSRELLYGTSLSRLGDTARAQAVFDAMLATPELKDMGSIYWTTLYERALIDLKEGHREDAQRRLQEAANAIEAVRSTISFEAGKIGFAGNTQAVYAALVRLQADAGDWNGAFLTAERAKARALVDLLAQVRSLGPPPLADDKVRDLLRRASADDGAVAAGIGSTGARERAAAARNELARAAPEAASLVSVQSVPLAAIAARLKRDESLIEYFAAGDDLFAFVLNGTSVKGWKLANGGLESEVRAFRAMIEHDDPSTAPHARALYDRLIRPLAGELQGASLTIVPHGALHYLPFAALRDGDAYLVDRFSLRVMPSASALIYVKAEKPRKAGGVLAFGNPDLGDPKYDLPRAQEEATLVAQTFPESKALVRAEATKDAVLEYGSGFAVLHFATHGVFEPTAPLSSALFLAKGKEADGRLTVSDLYSLRLDADLVTLSACETALGAVLTGDDVIGLSRGFLYAGARSIVASLWSVADAPTEKLMLAFYHRLATIDKLEALRLAQIDIRKTYPAPRFWAAFEVTGSGD